jgi:hypothetical protein
MAPPVVKHRVKDVEFLGRRVPVVLQAAGGASPLLAVGARPCSADPGLDLPSGAAAPPLRAPRRCD